MAQRSKSTSDTGTHEALLETVEAPLIPPAAPEQRSADQKNVLSALNNHQLLQTFALEFRNQVASALRHGKATHTIRPRGAQNRGGVVEMAIALEQIADGGDAAVLGALYTIKANLTRNELTLTPRERAARMLGRLKKGGREREADELDDALVTELLAGVENQPELLEIVSRMVQTREAMLEKLQQDKKFPTLLSHAAFHQRLDLEPDRIGVIVFADVSGFKAINDQYGQGFVDETVLRPIAEALPVRLPVRSGTRVSICRQGGDEFVVFFEDIEDQFAVAQVFAREFKRAVQNISRKLLMSFEHLLSDQVRGQLRNGDTEWQAIVAELHALECKIGVAMRNAGMKAASAESAANSRMIETKPYKNIVGFPTVTSSAPSIVRNAITGKAYRRDPSLKLAEGER
ncbi:diguanylate cyclase [Candidatus Peregrinibacteria bacterium]|nr:diguanylate cyclase [Candidatus Peregrinibacteria bacterium]